MGTTGMLLVLAAGIGLILLLTIKFKLHGLFGTAIGLLFHRFLNRNAVRQDIQDDRKRHGELFGTAGPNPGPRRDYREDDGNFGRLRATRTHADQKNGGNATPIGR